jgi:UDP-N-acetylmuramyl tripeptide synthase
VRAPLPLEIALARAVAGVSRLAGAGGGTTLPGKLLWKLDPDAVDRLAARLPRGSALVSATNGKTTTAAMTAEILAPSVRLAHNRAGANLVSGVASALVAARDAELGLFEVDEAALPEVARRVAPRAMSLGNLFRDQLDRYGELELLAARWREMSRELPVDATLVANGDDPQLGALAEERAGSVVFGLDDPSQASPELQHAADSKWCVRCGTPYEYTAAYIGHLGDYRCPACGHARPPLELAAREIVVNGLESVSFTLVTPEGKRRVELQVPGLYNVYNALAAAALSLALGASLDDVAAGLHAVSPAFGRAETVRLDDRDLSILLVKNPAGANEVLRTLALEPGEHDLLAILNDQVADGRDVSWVWDADFEVLAGRVRHVTCSGTRAAEMALRLKYAGVPTERIEVATALDEGLDRALRHGDGRLFALPTYTAMLGLRDVLVARGAAGSSFA